MDTITDFHFLFVPWFMLSMFCISWKWLTADTVPETLRMNSCFSHASSIGQKKSDLRMFTVVQLLRSQSEGPSIGHGGSLYAVLVI